MKFLNQKALFLVAALTILSPLQVIASPMPTKTVTKSKLDKAKNAIKKHAKFLIAGGVTIAAAVGIALLAKYDKLPKNPFAKANDSLLANNDNNDNTSNNK